MWVVVSHYGEGVCGLGCMYVIKRLIYLLFLFSVFPSFIFYVFPEGYASQYN